MPNLGLRRLAPWLNADAAALVEGRTTFLRSPVTDDFEGWCELRLKSRSFIEPWEPSWDDNEYTRTAFRLRLRLYESKASEDKAYAYFIFSKSDRKILGAITISNIRRGVAQTGTLGYWIGKPFANQGYMTDALSHLLPYAFSELALHRMEAACLPRNTPSARLLTRCGFSQEGMAKSYLRINGVWEDHLLFARIAR
jgi:ribosomal-protein-alanine N-acetyltransferase